MKCCWCWWSSPPLSHNAHPLRAVISAPADGSLGYNDHIWWHLSCIFLHYAFVEWKSDTWPHKLSIIIANQICTNRRVSALCFVNLPNMQKGIQDSRIYFEVRCRQLFEATDARSAVGGVILSILRGRMPVWMPPLLRVTVQHTLISKHLSLSWWWWWSYEEMRWLQDKSFHMFWQQFQRTNNDKYEVCVCLTYSLIWMRWGC